MDMPETSQKRQSVNFKKNFFENSAWEHQNTVVGIDEAGRGCLAGPLVVAAAMLPPRKAPSFLKDSKVMTLEERLEAYEWITHNCSFQASIIHNRMIDQVNIWQATLVGMKKALIQLLSQPVQRPSAILIDAMPLSLADTSYRDIPLYYFNKGESKSSSIAAASIVAKVTRDRLMEKYASLFPGYELESHKGYCTKIHQNHVKQLRPSIIHRTTYLTFLTAPSDAHHQQTIC